MEQQGTKKTRKRAFTGFGVALLFVLGFALFALFNFKTVEVSGLSMFPTLKDHQHVLTCHAYWLVGPIKQKDIVVIRDNNPNGYIIKRVYRLGGETVDWHVVPRTWQLTRGEYKVPAGQIYVLGDNREISEDSRIFGPVPIEKVMGKVVVLP